MSSEFDFLSLYFDDAGAGTETGAGTGNQNTETGAGTETGNHDNDNRNTPRYSDADLDKIIERKFAKWKKQQAAAVDEATKLANMTAQERAEHERDKLQKELDELKRANTAAEMERTARGILQADGVTVPDEIVSVLVGDDADTTSANVKAFAKTYKKAVQDEVKRQLTHKTPTAGVGGGTLTKADIAKETDPLKRQKLIRENLGLYSRKK